MLETALLGLFALLIGLSVSTLAAWGLLEMWAVFHEIRRIVLEWRDKGHV